MAAPKHNISEAIPVEVRPEAVESTDTEVPQIEIELDQPVTVDGYTRLVSPTGHETTVPDSIVEKLLDSGYIQS